MNRSQWEQSMLPCSEPFGYWFSGLVDGEGCFSVNKAKIGYVVKLTIKLRADDRPLLEKVRHELNVGSICGGDHSGPGFGNPWAAWAVGKKKDLLFITEVLDAFPLHSKKARDYAIWREAAIEYGVGSQPMDWTPIEEAFHALRAVREYVVDEGITPIETAPLLGLPSEGRRHG